MKELHYFIKRELPKINAYSGINTIKKQLVDNLALLVQDDDAVLLGILTPLDIIQRPHNLVIDCLSQKTRINIDCSIEHALQIMQEEQVDTLPVYKEGLFDGLVFKNDLIDFVTKQNDDLHKKVAEGTIELENINENLETSRKILNAFFNSTQSVIFLVSPDYKIMFFNKKAYDNSKTFHQKEIKVGDNIMDYIADTENNIYRSFKAEFERALKGEHVVSEKENKYTIDLSYWFQSEYFPVYEKEKIIGVAITVIDISERKKHELYIEKQNLLLKEISWTQSHKTRQPVATILGLMNVLDKAELSEKNKEIFELLETTTIKLDKVIRKTVNTANSLKKN